MTINYAYKEPKRIILISRRKVGVEAIIKRKQKHTNFRYLNNYMKSLLIIKKGEKIDYFF